MIKAGFIGAGKRAKSGHYPSVYNNPDVSIEAVSELDPEKNFRSSRYVQYP